jgi:hypothetical protein
MEGSEPLPKKELHFRYGKEEWMIRFNSSISPLISDEITGLVLICEFNLQPVNICSFQRIQTLAAWLSQTQVFGITVFL